MIEEFKDFFVNEFVDLKKKYKVDFPFYWKDLPPNSCKYEDEKGTYVIFDNGKKPHCCKRQLYSAHITHRYGLYDTFKVDFRTTIFGHTFWSVYRDYWYNEHAGFMGISSPTPDGYELERVVRVIPINSNKLEDGFKKINTSPLSNLVIDIIKSEMSEYGYDSDFFYYADRNDSKQLSLSQTLKKAENYKKEVKKYRT